MTENQSPNQSTERCPECGQPMLDKYDGWFCANGHRAIYREVPAGDGIDTVAEEQLDELRRRLRLMTDNRNYLANALTNLRCERDRWRHTAEALQQRLDMLKRIHAD